MAIVLDFVGVPLVCCVLPSASAVAGKLSQPQHYFTYTQTHVLCLGFAPLGGPYLKQEADVTTWPGNIGRRVHVLFSVSLLSLPWEHPPPPQHTHTHTHTLLCICGLLDSIDQPVIA